MFQRIVRIAIYVLIFGAVSGAHAQVDMPKIAKGQLLPAPTYARMVAGSAAQTFDVSIVYEEYFETGALLWTRTGSWVIGVPTTGPAGGHSSLSCAATNLSGNYQNSANCRLSSPAVTLPALAHPSTELKISFWEWFSIESGYDHGFVEISTDGGTNWQQLDDRSGGSGWRQTTIDISAYAGQSVKLGFHFTSDGTVTYLGWFVDDVEVTKQEPQPLTATLSSLNHQKFPFIYMNIAVDTFDVGYPGLTQSAFRVFENGVLQTDYFEVTPPDASGGARLADVVFLMDNSGSMSDDQNAVYNNLISFVNALSSSGIDFALGLCRYGASENSGYPIIQDNGILTSDANYFKNAVWLRNAIDGVYEPGWDALYSAANTFSFRPGSQKIFVLITDESPNYVTGGSASNLGVYTQAEAQTLLQAQTVTLFALIPLVSAVIQDYGSIAEATNGAYFNIDSPFDEILAYIESQVSNSYLVRYRSSNSVSDGTLRNVRVDVSYDGNAATCNGSYIPGSAPVIQRTQATLDLHTRAWAEGTAFTIEADIIDNIAPYVQSATVYYRITNVSQYSSIAMALYSGNTYRASIPASAVQNPGLDYYITATDGQTTSSDPRNDAANNPYQLGILPNVAPVITHTPVTTLTPGYPITITASIVDNTNLLFACRLYYRRIGQLLYQQAAMTSAGGGSYQAIIPAAVVTRSGVDYYLYAVDNFGVSSTHGTSDVPHSIMPVSGTIVLSNIHVKQHGEPQLNPYPPALSLGIRKGDEVGFEGIVKDGYGNPIANQQITAYDPLLYDPQMGSSGKVMIVSGSDGKFFYPPTGSISLAAVPPGVLAYWFKITGENKAIPFCLVVNDPSLTVDAVNQTLRQLTSANRSIIDIRVDASDQSPFRELYIPAEAYPSNDENLDAAENDGFFKFFSVVYTGPTDESFLIDNSYSAGWLKRGFDLYQNVINDVVGNLPERFELIIPPPTTFGHGKSAGFVMDYDPTETGNLIWYGIEGLVCASTFIPTGVTQVVGPVGCKAIVMHVATDIIKSAVTRDELQEPFGAAGNDELDEGLELTVDIGSLVYSAKDLPKHVARVQNPRNFMHGAPGRIKSVAEIGNFIKDLGQTSVSAWDYSNANGSYFTNSTGYFKGSSISNLGFIPPSGSFTRADLNFDFTRANKPSLDFSQLRWDDLRNPSYLDITVQSSRPTFSPATTTQVVPNLRIGTSNFTLQDVTPPNTAPFLYHAEIPVSQLPFYNPLSPAEWSEPLYCTGTNFETRGGDCTGGSCGINGISLYLINGSQLSRANALVTGDTIAVLRIPPSAFGNQSHFVTISSASFNSHAGQFQSNLVAHSDAIHISADVSSSILPFELKLSLSPIVPIQNARMLGVYKFIPAEAYWEKVQSNVSIGNSMASALICTTGIYAILEEVSDVSGPPTDGTLTDQNVYFFPNPFNPDHEIGRIRYSLAQDGNVVIKIYDNANALVKKLEDGSVKAKIEEAIPWDGRNERGSIVANGVYFYIIESSSGERAVGKIAVLR